MRSWLVINDMILLEWILELVTNYFLKTARRGFRQWSINDLPLAVDLWGDTEVTRFIGGPFFRWRSKAKTRSRNRFDECVQCSILVALPCWVATSMWHVKGYVRILSTNRFMSSEFIFDRSIGDKDLRKRQDTKLLLSPFTRSVPCVFSQVITQRTQRRGGYFTSLVSVSRMKSSTRLLVWSIGRD